MPLLFQRDTLYNYGGISPNNLVSYISTYNPIYSSSGGYFGTGTTVYDLTINNNNFSINNFYGYSGGITLPGNNTYLISSSDLISYFPSFNNQTQEVWFKNSFFGQTGSGIILAELGQNTINTSWHYSQIEIVGNTGYIGVWNGVINKIPVGSFNDGSWNCITWRYDGTGLTGFVNGSKITSINASRTYPSSLYQAIGPTDSTNMGNGTYYKGQIGSYKLYNRAITDSEILQNYNYEKQFFKRSVRVNIIGPGETASYYSDILTKITTAMSSLYPSIQLIITQNNSSTYSGSDLSVSTYDCIFIFSDGNYSNSSLGTNINNYVSSGGGLVISVFTIASVRLTNFTYTNCPVAFPGNQTMTSSSLGSYTSSDPLMNGVSTFNPGTSKYGAGGLTLNSGATTVASYNDGNILVAKQTIGSARTVALNFFPPSSTARSDFWTASTDGGKIMTNAIIWSGKGI